MGRSHFSAATRAEGASHSAFEPALLGNDGGLVFLALVGLALAAAPPARPIANRGNAAGQIACRSRLRPPASGIRHLASGIRYLFPAARVQTQPRCRLASYKNTAAALATFNESTVGGMGTATAASHAARICGESP